MKYRRKKSIRTVLMRMVSEGVPPPPAVTPYDLVRGRRRGRWFVRRSSEPENRQVQNAATRIWYWLKGSTNKADLTARIMSSRGLRVVADPTSKASSRKAKRRALRKALRRLGR